MFQTKVVEKLEIYILNSTYIYIYIYFFENRTFYEIMWENVVEPGRPQMAIWRIRIACWVPKATHTHNQVVY
jgi:hypothetical protein